MNRVEEALEYYGYAIQRNSEDSRYFINKGEALQRKIIDFEVQKQNRLEEALEQYNCAIKQNPENSKYYFYKANNLLSRQQLKVKYKK